jgi:hypothetical protein
MLYTFAKHIQDLGYTLENDLRLLPSNTSFFVTLQQIRTDLSFLSMWIANIEHCTDNYIKNRLESIKLNIVSLKENPGYISSELKRKNIIEEIKYVIDNSGKIIKQATIPTNENLEDIIAKANTATEAFNKNQKKQRN